MKQLRFLLLAAAALLAVPFVIQCSSPLEALDDNGGPGNVFYDTVYSQDTLLHFDTIINTDSVMVYDTVYSEDTVVFWDTVTTVDTVYVELTDSNDVGHVCGRLSCFRKKIVWLLQNTAGTYRLTFTADVDRDKPARKLYVYIDGQRYKWTPKYKPEWTINKALSADAKIKICPEEPHAFGHAVDICLSFERTGG